MVDKTAFLSSIATLILFCFYFIGRIITILSVKRIWRDKVIMGDSNYSQYEIVDAVYNDASTESKIYGILLSREGMRKIRVYKAYNDGDNQFLQKKSRFHAKEKESLLSLDFLNIDQAIAFTIEPGELYPSLIIEYTSFDYMKIRMEWRDNLKNGVYSELVKPVHTVNSFLYYLFR